MRARYNVDARDQADDLVGAGARGTPSSRSWTMFTQLRPVRALRLDRGRLGDHAAPDEQFTKLGSVGRECVGSRPIRLLDPDGSEVPDGEAGELYSCNAYTFDGYWKLPDKTKEAFRGDYCTRRRSRPARRGRLHLSGRPQEQHDHLRRRERLSVRGGSRARRGIPRSRTSPSSACPTRNGASACTPSSCCTSGAALSEAEILDWCRDRIAGYKRPRSVSFLRDEDMPRTATGKILHRVLKDRLNRLPG